jgi:multiple antibiotic resistance protein
MTIDLISDYTLFISAFTAIFAIVNPISGVMTFISLTAKMSDSDRIYVAKRSVILACAIALIFAISGEYILRFFSITTYSLMVAGGILLFLVALDMLFARTTRESITSEELSDAEHKDNISIFPIAMPMLTGPGAIATIIISTTGGNILQLKFIVIVAILLTFVITFLIFLFSDFFHMVVGMTGMLVMTRMMGLFLGAIAVNFVSEGIKGLFHLGSV